MQTTRSIVDLSHLLRNLQVVRTCVGRTAIFPVVKANAYGHGAIPVCHALQPFVQGFCVAIIQEGVALRVAGVTLPILVFTSPRTAEELSVMAFYDLTATVTDTLSAKLCRPVDCHIKVNTGMNRYGCPLAELPSILSILNDEHVKGVYSHLYLPSDVAVREKQRRLFQKAVAQVKAVQPQALAHLSASAGILCGKLYHFDAVRPGLMLYGYAPQGFQADVHPVLSVYAERRQITAIQGDGAGYQRLPDEILQTATYRAGYADGLPYRSRQGYGHPCMDAFVGADRGEWVPVMTDATAYDDAIPYEILLHATERSELYYQS